MRLNQFAAERRLAILEDLKDGHSPREGTFDQTLFKEAMSKGHPQMGSTRFEPDAIHLEYIFPDPLGAPIILSVHLVPPERIVYMPVPEWVVENIWQGEVEGTYQFESDALTLLERFRQSLSKEENPTHFSLRQALGKA